MLLTLWMTAERWGRMTPAGVVVDAPLTHALIAEMAGASRPYVTKGIVKLTASGEISRRSDGRFILHGESPG